MYFSRHHAVLKEGSEYLTGIVEIASRISLVSAIQHN